MKAILLALLLAGCATVEPVTAPVVSSMPLKVKPAITKPIAQEHIARRSIWDRFWRNDSKTTLPPR